MCLITESRVLSFDCEALKAAASLGKVPRRVRQKVSPRSVVCRTDQQVVEFWYDGEKEPHTIRGAELAAFLMIYLFAIRVPLARPAGKLVEVVEHGVLLKMIHQFTPDNSHLVVSHAA